MYNEFILINFGNKEKSLKSPIPDQHVKITVPGITPNLQTAIIIKREIKPYGLPCKALVEKLQTGTLQIGSKFGTLSRRPGFSSLGPGS
jgi:hypothetical protein